MLTPDIARQFGMAEDVAHRAAKKTPMGLGRLCEQGIARMLIKELVKGLVMPDLVADDPPVNGVFALL